MKPVALMVAFALGLGLGALGASARLSRISTDQAEAPAAASTAPAGAIATGTPASHTCPDEAQLRRVVREELVAAQAASVLAQGAAANVGEPGSAVQASPLEEVERVNRRVDDYIRAGAISEAEMARLQSEIGKLDPAARRAAMQRLVRALNSGALDGRL